MKHPPIEEVVEHYVQDCLLKRTAPRVSELALRLKCTVVQLSRRFERATGAPLGRYLRERQIAAACELLRNSEEPMAKVAEQCGFTTLRSFFRTFRRITGSTPAAFRREKNVSIHRQT